MFWLILYVDTDQYTDHTSYDGSKHLFQLQYHCDMYKSHCVELKMQAQSAFLPVIVTLTLITVIRSSWYQYHSTIRLGCLWTTVFVTTVIDQLSHPICICYFAEYHTKSHSILQPSHLHTNISYALYQCDCSICIALSSTQKWCKVNCKSFLLAQGLIDATHRSWACRVIFARSLLYTSSH